MSQAHGTGSARTVTRTVTREGRHDTLRLVWVCVSTLSVMAILPVVLGLREDKAMTTPELKLTWWLLWLALAVVYCAVVEICWADSIEGKASYYTVKSCQQEGTNGVYTASGEKYNEMSMTCALPSHAFGGRYKVCTPQHVCVVVRHNDYGPGRKPRAKGVIVDLSPTAFAKLSPLSVGIIPISIEQVE